MGLGAQPPQPDSSSILHNVKHPHLCLEAVFPALTDKKLLPIL